MNQRNLLSLAGKLTVAALLVAVAGIVIQIVSGVDYPTVPPGIVILLVTASVVAFGPWRWAPVAGVVVGLFLLVGFFASGAAARLLRYAFAKLDSHFTPYPCFRYIGPLHDHLLTHCSRLVSYPWTGAPAFLLL